MCDLLKKVGVVVIGRNEALRLGACLDSLGAMRDRLVYVDSGSSDGSPEIAETHGVRVVRLTQGPFSAARGRQVGWEELHTQYPEIDYVQFVDGDCIIQPGWVEKAFTYLEDNPDVAVVVGRLREQHADKSLLIRLVDVDWDLPTGEIDAIGGISMARLSAIREAGGWRTDLIAGEELDLGARLRAQGWKLIRLPDDMTLHDMGIKNWNEFWRRAVRSGYGYAELARLHGVNRCRRWLRKTISHFVYGAVLPVLFLLALVAWWPADVAIAGLYGILLFRVTRGRVKRGDPVNFAFLYAMVIVACKVAGAIGAFKYLVGHFTGKKSKLIEYKSVTQAEG